jgi:hypothetical protein
MAQANGNGYYTQVATDERPIGELFQELAQDARSMINLELTLAQSELSEKASIAGKGAAMTAAGGLIIYAGVLALIAALIFALATALPAWLSALIVGVVVALIGCFVVRAGLSNLKGPKLMPNQTMSILKDDKNWLKDPTQGASMKSGGA